MFVFVFAFFFSPSCPSLFPLPLPLRLLRVDCGWRSVLCRDADISVGLFTAAPIRLRESATMVGMECCAHRDWMVRSCEVRLCVRKVLERGGRDEEEGDEEEDDDDDDDVCTL